MLKQHLLDIQSISYLFSAKSRVKGFLEIYHAYIREPNTGSTDEEESTPAEGEPGWEMIDGVQTATGTVEAPAQVGTHLTILNA